MPYQPPALYPFTDWSGVGTPAADQFVRAADINGIMDFLQEHGQFENGAHDSSQITTPLVPGLTAGTVMGQLDQISALLASLDARVTALE